MTRILFENVSKSYGRTEVLKQFDLEINDKELFVLLGASGAGKSTILKLIAGIEEPSSGKIYFDDTMVNQRTPRERDVALMFQSYALYPNWTVYQNLAFPLKVRKRPKDEIQSAVIEVSGRLGLSSSLEKYPGMLSGGERQRLAVGRAMIRKPKVYLFDEPLTNLDAKLRVVTRTEIKRLQRELGATTVYATPDTLEATTIADRIAVLRGGDLEQVGTPEFLYRKPVDTYVAEFTGVARMNFMSCSASVEGRILHLIGEGFDLRLSLHDPDDKVPEKVILGVRPEDVILAPKAEGIDAKILVVEPTRPETMVYLAVGRRQVTALVSAGAELRAGAQVKIGFKKSGLHIFSAETRKTLGLVWNGQSKN